MKKECQFVILPTDKSEIFLKADKLVYFPSRCLHTKDDDNKIYPHHIYILSDAEIKDGDWIIVPTSDGKTEFDWSDCKPEKSKHVYASNKFVWKIIASTDPELHYTKNRLPGVTTYDKNILKISQSDIEYIISLYNGKGKEIDVKKIKQFAKDECIKYSKDIQSQAEKFQAQIDYEYGFLKGYNQCLQDNADKKFTLEDIKRAWEHGAYIQETDCFNTNAYDKFIESLTKEQPKKDTVMVEYEVDPEWLLDHPPFSAPYPPAVKIPKTKDGYIVIVKG